MSEIFTITLRFVNRNLQLTLLAGAIALAMVLHVLELDAAKGLSFFDLTKLLVLLGLPIMLAIQWRSPAERILARGTATTLSAAALAHTLFYPSSASPLFLALLFIVMGQVSLMRHLDHGRAHASR